MLWEHVDIRFVNIPTALLRHVYLKKCSSNWKYCVRNILINLWSYEGIKHKLLYENDKSWGGVMWSNMKPTWESLQEDFFFQFHGNRSSCIFYLLTSRQRKKQRLVRKWLFIVVTTWQQEIYWFRTRHIKCIYKWIKYNMLWTKICSKMHWEIVVVYEE